MIKLINSTKYGLINSYCEVENALIEIGIFFSSVNFWDTNIFFFLPPFLLYLDSRCLLSSGVLEKHFCTWVARNQYWAIQKGDAWFLFDILRSTKKGGQIQDTTPHQKVINLVQNSFFVSVEQKWWRLIFCLVTLYLIQLYTGCVYIPSAFWFLRLVVKPFNKQKKNDYF